MKTIDLPMRLWARADYFYGTNGDSTVGPLTLVFDLPTSEKELWIPLIHPRDGRPTQDGYAGGAIGYARLEFIELLSPRLARFALAELRPADASPPALSTLQQVFPGPWLERYVSPSADSISAQEAGSLAGPQSRAGA